MSESTPPADWQGTQAEWDEQVAAGAEAAEEERRRAEEAAQAEAQQRTDDAVRAAEEREAERAAAEEREKVLDGGSVPDEFLEHHDHVMLTSEGHGSSEEDYRTD